MAFPSKFIVPFHSFSIFIRTFAEDLLLCTMQQDYDSSVSGYLSDSFEGLSQVFTDVEILNTSEVNVVAKAKRYGRWWLLKGLQQGIANEAGYQQRLRKELEILMQLQHPNIVSAFALEKVDGLGLCIVMEFIEGSTLKEWLQGETQRQTRQRIARELTEAVGYIHTKGIVHRDLKPENIIITHNGENVKLIDFGLADTDSHAVLKQPAGTPRYMSPEQMQDSVADVRNDIYSLGIIFQQMKLGLGYRSIIKRCIQPIDRRYPNVQTLQKTVVRQKARVRWGMILAVALILLITIGALVALGLRQKEQNTFIREQQGITATQQTQIKQQRQKMDSLQQQVGEKVGEVTDYQKRQQKKEEEELHQQQSQERMSNAFMAGIDSLRKAVKADGSSIDERYHRGQYAIEHFMQTQTHGLTKKEKEEVRTSLIQNLDAYMRVWKKTEEQLNRMQNEYNNPTTD